MKRAIVLASVLSLLGSATLHAQAPAPALSPDQFVAIRKAVMDLQQGAAGAMKAAVETKADVKPLVAAADGILASSKLIPTLFPAGTEKANETKAKPEVWSDQAGFAKAANDLTAAAEKLVTLAKSDDKDGFAAQFGAMGRTCGACHRQFKEKD